MSGIDFADTIIVRCTEKGTRATTRALRPMSWAGEKFKKSQERKISKINGLRIESAKGTARIDLAKLCKTSIPKLDGRYVSVRKGTEMLKI